MTPFQRRAECSFGEHWIRWVFWAITKLGERTQWVPFSLLFVCQSELIELSSQSLAQNLSAVKPQRFFCGLRLRCPFQTQKSQTILSSCEFSEPEIPPFLRDFWRFGSVSVDISGDCDCAISGALSAESQWVLSSDTAFSKQCSARFLPFIGVHAIRRRTSAIQTSKRRHVGLCLPSPSVTKRWRWRHRRLTPPQLRTEQKLSKIGETLTCIRDTLWNTCFTSGRYFYLRLGLFGLVFSTYLQFPPSGNWVWSFLLAPPPPVSKFGLVFFTYGSPTVSKKEKP